MITQEEHARVCADRDEWMERALRYQARHAGLRALQLAVQDVTRALTARMDPELDGYADLLVQASARASEPAHYFGAAWESFDAVKAEVQRLRARVRVETSDVERVGLTLAHVDAWLQARGWEPSPTGSYSAVARWTHPTWGGRHILAVSATPSALADTVNRATDRVCCQRPSLDVLDEMRGAS
jgi:hypothetical protein